MPQPIFVPALSAPDAGPDIARQTSVTLARLDERLRTERSSLADVVVVTVYLRHAADFAAMNDAYRPAWKGLPPTRSTIVAAPLNDALVEISATAVPSGAERRLVHPPSWMASPNPYSYGLRSGDTLYLSGLIARNGRDNSAVPGDIAVQTRVVIDNAKELLGAAGLSLPHVVSNRVFLPNLADFDGMNRVYREYFPEGPPVRATVGAALAGPQNRVEMTLVAFAGARQTIDGDGARNPNLSAAVAAGECVYFSGLLPDAAAISGDGAAQTRDIIRKLDGLLGRAGVSRANVRDLLVYVTDDAAARGAVAECRAAFAAAAITPVKVALAMPGAKVEIMTAAVKP
jgi:enamine deaminase RidA (YjgF/YER057c/UK114 family)